MLLPPFLIPLPLPTPYSSDIFPPQWSRQEGGWGLHMVLQEQENKLTGIVNGVDYNTWHPCRDHHLTSDGYRQYSVESFVEGKAQCKAALQG